MSNNDHINQLVNQALNSADGAERASAKPFLFTRIQAAMQRRPETFWERAGRFIARPSVAIAGLCLVLAVNLAAVVNSSDKLDLQEEVTTNTDDFSSTVAVVYDIDNNEP
jgi:uncharacterized membrane protein YdfJ with MMPL/SSD domain